MIRSLTLRNFRAFRNQTFRFGRFNIFVGPNNSGKSSALSALNMIAQTVLSSELNQTPLVLNGDFDSLGTYLDMVHGGRANTPMGIDLQFDDYEIRIEFKYRSQRREIEIVRWELFDKKNSIFSYSSKGDSFEVKLLGQAIERILPNARKQRPVFRNLMPSTANYSSLIFSRMQEDKLSDSTFGQLRRADRALNQARLRLRRSFSHFDSLSPFREKPERTYLYSGVTAERIGTTGANTATLMASDAARRGSESKGLQSAISNWFKLSNIAKSIQIDTIGPRHFEIVLVDFDERKHNISDVGFGCSQVLPVLAATLNVFRQRVRTMGNPTLIVQEPEIHLHPNAQAALGSFFAGIVPEDGQLFLETHSDNLILRLARHVADSTIDHSDIRVFYVHKIDAISRVNLVSIDDEGFFSSDWPGGFFPQRQSESLALAQQSDKSKERSRHEIQLIFELQGGERT